MMECPQGIWEARYPCFPILPQDSTGLKGGNWGQVNGIHIGQSYWLLREINCDVQWKTTTTIMILIATLVIAAVH